MLKHYLLAGVLLSWSVLAQAHICVISELTLKKGEVQANLQVIIADLTEVLTDYTVVPFNAEVTDVTPLTLNAHHGVFTFTGVGAGTIAIVLGILASIVMAFFAILWYPVKRLIKKRKAAQKVDAHTSGGSGNS